MPAPLNPGKGTGGSVKVNDRSQFARQWSRLWYFGWGPSFYGQGNPTSVFERPRNVAARTNSVYDLGLENSFFRGGDHSFVNDIHGRGISFAGSGNAFLASDSVAWRPDLSGGYAAGTMFVLFKRTAAFPNGSYAYVYSISDVFDGFGRPSISIIAGTNVAGDIIGSSGTQVQPVVSGFAPTIGDLICVAFTTRANNDHEVAACNFSTGQFGTGTSTTAISSAGKPTRESIAANLRSSSIFDYFAGNVYMAGFAPFGMSSTDLATLAQHPFDLIAPEFPDLLSQAALVQTRSRVIWM